ncbi:efflux RND transporter periplasmic adaptor subunit [Aquicoccus sp. SCR17]|nr:efflux RND transporter periplasmic adaptor subunit [Carideicomes alvinocaridis]
MTRFTHAMAGLAAVVLFVAGAASGQEAPEPAPRPVVTEIVSADPTRERTFPGRIEAAHETRLAFQTIGRVAELTVERGDRVEQDEVLATLDRVSLREDLRSARAALDAAEAEADFAARSLERTTTLHERDIATDAQLERARANAEAKEAQVQSARAQLASAQEALSYGRLTAPADGVVLSVEVEQGSVVSAGATVLVLAALDSREAVIDVPSEYLSVLPDEAVFDVTAHAGMGEPVTARLRLVDPVAEQSLRSRRLRLALEDPPPAFRFGSLVTARYAGKGAPVMTLPRSAVVTDNGERFVWRITGDPRRVEKVAVQTGAGLADRVEVHDGLSVGDEIVVKGAHSLEDGQRVGPRYTELSE